MLRYLLPGFVLFLLAVPLSAAEVDAEDFFDDTFGDFQEELENAKDQGKKAILFMFEMDECPFCARMKQNVLNQSEVQEYFHENFLIFTVDIEGDIEIVDFAGNSTTQKEFSLKQFRVRATPVFQFVDLEGKPMKLGRYTGATKDAEEFMLLGRFIVEGKNEVMPFVRYKRAV